MDRGKKSGKFISNKNNKIYMDLKDIIRENALPFLPAKSLRRCTGVCRDWKLQISTPFFAHSQSNSFRDVSGFFCQSSSEPPSFISLDPMSYGVPDASLKFLPEPVDIRCSSNGLLCCQGRTGYKAYYICNPVTRQWKKLPQPIANHGSDPAVVLVFEPSLLNFVADYKLVCPFLSELDGIEFEIYSSATGSWKISGEICYGKEIIPRSGVHVRGVIYWLSKKTYYGGIIAFDLTSERTTFLSSYGSGSLGQSNGKLCSANFHGSRLYMACLANAYTNTMQMHSHHKAWDREKEITLNNLAGDGRFSEQVNVLYIGDDLVVVRSGRTLVSYNMRTKESRRLTAEVDRDAKMVPYVNSLVEI